MLVQIEILADLGNAPGHRAAWPLDEVWNELRVQQLATTASLSKILTERDMESAREAATH